MAGRTTQSPLPSTEAHSWPVNGRPTAISVWSPQTPRAGPSTGCHEHTDGRTLLPVAQLLSQDDDPLTEKQNAIALKYNNVVPAHAYAMLGITQQTVKGKETTMGILFNLWGEKVSVTLSDFQQLFSRIEQCLSVPSRSKR